MTIKGLWHDFQIATGHTRWAFLLTVISSYFVGYYWLTGVVLGLVHEVPQMIWKRKEQTIPRAFYDIGDFTGGGLLAYLHLSHAPLWSLGAGYAALGLYLYAGHRKVKRS